MFMIPRFALFDSSATAELVLARRINLPPLGLLYDLLDVLFDVAYRGPDRADVLLNVSLCFEVLVAYGLANDFLDLALNFFGSPFYLILVDAHDSPL
jgi:hypothetical protein